MLETLVHATHGAIAASVTRSSLPPCIPDKFCGLCFAPVTFPRSSTHVIKAPFQLRILPVAMPSTVCTCRLCLDTQQSPWVLLQNAYGGELRYALPVQRAATQAAHDWPLEAVHVHFSRSSELRSWRMPAQVAAMTRSQAGAAASSRKSSSGSSSSSGVVERALHRSRQRPSHAVHALVRQIACRNTIV